LLGLTIDGGWPAYGEARRPAPPAAVPTSFLSHLPPDRAPATLAFAGDIHFEGPLATRLATEPAAVLAEVAPVLQAADLAVINLETALTDRGRPESKRFTFRAPSAALLALSEAGIDVASMANNHGLDYGAEGLADTLAARREAAPLAVIGIGANATDALAPFRTTINGWRISVLAATDVLDGTLEPRWTATGSQGGVASAKRSADLEAAVSAARADSDTVVVVLHWGVEGSTCPTERQRVLARALTNAGADVIVGSHAHRLQGAGRLGDAFVAYGLGNFAFSASSPGAATSGVLRLSVAGRRVVSYEWLPAHIVGGAPQPLRGDSAARALSAWHGLRTCTGLEP
jgi:poly-gamma-glutamate synthesis protein (capsule biosynthesis protein)